MDADSIWMIREICGLYDRLMDRRMPTSMFGSSKTNLALIVPFVGLMLSQQPAVHSLDYEYSTISGKGSYSTEIIWRQEAPQFALRDINGRTVRLSDYRGKWSLLTFGPPGVHRAA